MGGPKSSKPQPVATTGHSHSHGDPTSSSHDPGHEHTEGPKSKEVKKVKDTKALKSSGGYSYKAVLWSVDSLLIVKFDVARGDYTDSLSFCLRKFFSFLFFFFFRIALGVMVAALAVAVAVIPQVVKLFDLESVLYHPQVNAALVRKLETEIRSEAPD